MTDTENPAPEPEIKSGEDWKARVKAEDARLDAKRTEVGETGSSSIPDSPPPIDPERLPQPTLSTLVGLFSTQAMVSLGFIPHPEDGQTEVQLPLARHLIDLLGVLEEKTKGNLTDPEHNLLEQSLHDLRMAYLELSRAQ